MASFVCRKHVSICTYLYNYFTKTILSFLYIIENPAKVDELSTLLRYASIKKKLLEVSWSSLKTEEKLPDKYCKEEITVVH